MNIHSKQFSEFYQYTNYEINLINSYDPDILNGYITFYDCTYKNNYEIKKTILDIKFIIINSFSIEDICTIADSISGDLEYVTSAYRNYCNDISGLGSVVIIEDLNIKKRVESLDHKIQLIKYFLTKTIEALQIIGTGTLLFQSKSIDLYLKNPGRIRLINQLLDIGIIPIYQDFNDVVLARNLDYII